jgi:hypothetical protein
MVDISKLGGYSMKGVPFPEFGNSLAEAAAGMPNVSKAVREALSCERLGSAVGELSTIDRATKDALLGRTLLDDLDSTTRGLSASFADKQLEEAQRSITAALGGSLGDYYKSRDHMRDVFGSKSLGDEAAKLINGPSAGDEIDRYMADLERSSDRLTLSELPPLPPMPPNPIHETNEHLADLGEKIDALVDLQAKGAEVIDKLLKAQIANEAAQERSDRRAYRLSVINTVLATILGLLAIVVTIVR